VKDVDVCQNHWCRFEKPGLEETREVARELVEALARMHDRHNLSLNVRLAESELRAKLGLDRRAVT
jgi:hypothetical protein